MPLPTSGHLQRVLAQLHGVQRNGHGFAAQCPAHEDRTPSLTVSEGRDGRVVLHCHAGCSPDDVVRAAGLEMSDLFVPRDRPEVSRGGSGPARMLVATYDYRDADGAVLYQVMRYAPKAFRQRRPDPHGGWMYSLGDVPRVLYRLHETRQAMEDGKRIFVVEGERDADALCALGLVATTNAGGAGKWREEYSAELRGADVIVLPDNDEPGRAHATDVATSLMVAGCTVRIVELPGVDAKGDVSDWLAAGGTVEVLDGLCERAPLFVPTEESRPDIASSAPHTRPSPPRYSGGETGENEPAAGEYAGAVLTPFSQIERRSVEWVWRHRVPRGALTLVEGPAGIGKTSVLIDMLARVSCGSVFPDGEPAPLGDVVIVGPEDAAGTVLRPRLDAAGADLDRVFLAERSNAEGEVVPLELPRDVGVLRHVLARCEAPRVLYIDALNDLLIGIKINDDAEVRKALRPLARLAEESGVAVVATRHFGKSGNRFAALAGLGSVGFGAVARSVCQVYADAATPGRLLLASAKSNLGPKAPTLAFMLEPTTADDPPRVAWVGIDGRSADDLQQEYRQEVSGQDASDRSQLDEACEWLAAELASGSKPKTQLMTAAKKDGITARTLERAKVQLGARHIRAGFGGPVSWELPGAALMHDEAPHTRQDEAHTRHPRHGNTVARIGEDDGENGVAVLLDEGEAA